MITAFSMNSKPIEIAQPHPDERTLIRRAQKGDLQAFQWVVRQYESRVLAVSLRITGNEADARDVAQEAFIRVYRHFPSWKRKTKFFTWLYRIVVNAGYDHLKREKRFRSLSLDEAPAGSLPVSLPAEQERNDCYENIRALIDSLSTPRKTAFVLREVEGLSCREIAQVMAVPQGTVRSHLHHARNRLKQLIQCHYPEYLEGIGS